MSDVYQVSYTGDILGHRRCPRAWLYERHVGLRPYEQVQAMEGNLAHFAMEWLTKHYRKHGTYPKATELEQEMLKRFSVLRSRGIRSEFAKKAAGGGPGCRGGLSPVGKFSQRRGARDS